MNHTATANRFCAARGRWSALNIVLMVIGFAVFWPLGLAMLAWIVWGDEIGRKTEELKGQFWSFSERTPSFRAGSFRDTGNVAFDEYREETLRKLEEDQREFQNYLDKLRAAKDRAEFDQFMNERRNRPTAPPAPEAPTATA